MEGSLPYESHLQKIVARRLDKLLLQLLFVVILAWRWLLLLKLHDLIGKGRAGAAQELASATTDIVAPVRMLHVFGAWDVI